MELHIVNAETQELSTVGVTYCQCFSQGYFKQGYIWSMHEVKDMQYRELDIVIAVTQ